MNDEENKPVAKGDNINNEIEQNVQPDTGLAETETKEDLGATGAVSLDVKPEATLKSDEIDITAALKENEEAEEEPEEELSELDKELGRVEGIESTAIAGVSVASATDEKDEVESASVDTVSDAVDLDPVTPAVAKDDSPLVAAIRKQEKDRGGKKRKLSIFTSILGLLLVIAVGAAGFFFAQNTTLANEKESVAKERDELKAKNTELKNQQVTASEEARRNAAENVANKDTQVSASDYVVITELGARYKKTPENAALIHGYTVVTDNTAADSVAFSTKTLARVVQSAGASATYPCLFTGNVPTITRYTQDLPVGDSTASKVGKKIGEAYYVYAPAVGPCAQTNAAEITVRDTAVKALFDTLEALPATTTASTTTPAATTPAQ